MNSEATTAGAPQAKPATAPPPQAVFQINCRHCGSQPALPGSDVAFEWRRLPMSQIYQLAVTEHCVCIFRCPVCGSKGQNRVEAMQGMTFGPHLASYARPSDKERRARSGPA